MMATGQKASFTTLLARLKACSGLKDLGKGRLVHAEIADLGAESNVYLASSLVNMYSKCRSVGDARKVFDKIAERDLILWNTLMLGYVENDEGEQAFNLFSQMRSEGVVANGLSYVTALKACTRLAESEESTDRGGKHVKPVALEKGKLVHQDARENNFAGLDIRIQNTLLNFYFKCGSLEDAMQVFYRMPAYSLVSWTVTIMGCAENGEGETALSLFKRMKSSEDVLDAQAFVAALKACTSLAVGEKGTLREGKTVKAAALERGRFIYTAAVKDGFGGDKFVGNCSIDMFAKCGSLADAREAFDSIVRRDAISFTSLMLGYIESGDAGKTWDAFEQMELERCTPSPQAYVAAVKACSMLAEKQTWKLLDGVPLKLECLEKGMALHSRTSSADVYLASALVEMYFKCGSNADGRRVFDHSRSHDVVLWTALLIGYAENGEEVLAFQLFSFMKATGLAPDCRTYVAMIKACAAEAEKEDAKGAEGGMSKLRSLEKGVQIHVEAADHGFHSDLYVASSLVDMYSKCLSMVDARKVFEEIRERDKDVVLWTTLISGYAENGEEDSAFGLFVRMREEGHAPNPLTFVAVLKACVGLAVKEESRLVDNRLVKVEALEKGVEAHKLAIEASCEHDKLVAVSLVDMYAHCGCMEDARTVFDKGRNSDSPAARTALMLGYTRTGQPEAALKLFHVFEHVPDTWMVVAALKACSSLAEKEQGRAADGKVIKLVSLDKGMAVHSEAMKTGSGENKFVRGRLVDLYTKCGSMVDARAVLDRMDDPDATLWSTLMIGYAENGEAELTLELFKALGRDVHRADARVCAAVVKACGSLADLDQTKHVHAEICRSGLEADEVLVTCLVDSYGKCGTMPEAQHLFDCLATTRDPVTWTSLLAGYSRGGDTRMVFNIFTEMVDEHGLQPNEVALRCVLTCCSHAGLVDRGRKCFADMKARFGLEPGTEHYVCMVDMLSRANQLEEAVELARKTASLEAREVAWMSVLGACNKWKNAQVGKVAFDSLVTLQGKSAAAAYDLMFNIYSDAT